MASAVSADTPPPYPVRLTIERPERQSRLLNFPLLVGTVIRLLLLIPNLVVLNAVASAAFYAWFVSLWGILFTGRYPRGLFKLVAGTIRWFNIASAYFSHLTDEYPPMDLDDRPSFPIRIEFDYPGHPSRWLNLPFLPVKFLLVIPNLIVLYFLGIVSGVLGFIALFAILFTGSYPAGLYSFVSGVLRWSVRLQAYLAGLTDKYPPFSMN